MGMVFQNFNLFPYKKVIENIMLAPVLLNKGDKVKLQDRALHLLDKVGLKVKQMRFQASYLVVKNKELQLQEL